MQLVGCESLRVQVFTHDVDLQLYSKQQSQPLNTSLPYSFLLQTQMPSLPPTAHCILPAGASCLIAEFQSK